MMLIRELRKEDYEEYILLINEFRPIDMYINREKFEEIYDIICKNSIIFVGILDNQIICSAKLIGSAAKERNGSIGGHVRLDKKNISAFSKPYSTVVSKDKNSYQVKRLDRDRTPIKNLIYYKFLDY